MKIKEKSELVSAKKGNFILQKYKRSNQYVVYEIMEKLKLKTRKFKLNEINEESKAGRFDGQPLDVFIELANDLQYDIHLHENMDDVVVHHSSILLE